MVFQHLTGPDDLDGSRAFSSRSHVATLPADGLELHSGHAGQCTRRDRPNRLRALRAHGRTGAELSWWVFPARVVDAAVHFPQVSITRRNANATNHCGLLV